MKSLLMLMFASLAAMAAQSGGCQDTPVTWTLYTNYVDPDTGLTMTSQITGDGLKTDSSGNTVYASSNGSVQVAARLNNCGTHPTYDATLQLTRGRSFNVNLGIQLGNVYQMFPPTYSFFNESGGALLNINNIMWCQNNGFPNGCTFYTRGGATFTGPDSNTYHLRMENPTSVPVSHPFDSMGNCPYNTSQVQVVFTPGKLSPSGKDTYVVTPVLQGTNTGSGWIAPALASGCPTPTLPAGTWPAAVGVLVQGIPAVGNNFGQYDTPFKYVIQNQ
jgi:hypothetical protein